MRKILIPTDFSDNAFNAIKYALELFKYDISQFYIMHAYQDEIYADETLLNRQKLDTITKQVHKTSTKKLENVLKLINDISPNPRHEYHIISTNNILVDEADKIVDKENIDVIVMGTRGETNDRRLTFGSHTLQVLKYVQCPVLAIPENYKYTQPKHIMFPTNYMIPYKRRELKLLCELAVPFRAKIDVVYISKSDKLSMRQEDNKRFINNELCKNQINFLNIKNKDITKSILNYIEINDVDMLVMVNTRHSFLENILFQSTISKLSLHLEIPFLALQNIKRI
ncbi:universal stress protein [Xanthomarina sp. F2636L]|uniref:universal stress protein n=1 Tax=Xanthomarina sp. F2636L TaxID=2996018 RepID=UPI00225E1F52|nr:universal stress protein [Xanthomarina sp. F2636L]MCX7551737.1 universal stress protein [Xanthomarina sp. F2636L]